MNWFKDILKDSQAKVLPPIPEKKPNISEPVISFVETFKANPKRFKVKLRPREFLSFSYYHYTLTDTKAKLEWLFSIKDDSLVLGNSVKIDRSSLYSYPSFLTIEEADFIFDNLNKEFNYRVNKLYNLRLIRSQRVLNNQREALKKVYCK